MYRLTSSDVMPLKEFISQTLWRGARKVCIQVLFKALAALLKPLKQAAESAFQASLERKKTWKRYGTVTSCCYDISAAKNTSAIWYGTERQHPLVRCRSTNENTVMDRGSLTSAVPEKMKARRMVKRLERGG